VEKASAMVLKGNAAQKEKAISRQDGFNKAAISFYDNELCYCNPVILL